MIMSKDEILDILKEMYEKRVLVAKQNCSFETSSFGPDLKVLKDEFIIIDKIYIHVSQEAWTFNDAKFMCTLTHDFKKHSISLITFHDGHIENDHFQECLNTLDDILLIGERLE